MWDLVGNPEDWFSHNEAKIRAYLNAGKEIMSIKVSLLSKATQETMDLFRIRHFSLYNTIMILRFWARYIYATSAEPDQTAHREQPHKSTLLAIACASYA